MLVRTFLFVFCVLSVIAPAADQRTFDHRFRVPVQTSGPINVVAVHSLGNQLVFVVDSGGSSLAVLTTLDGKAINTAAVGEKVNQVLPLGDRLLLVCLNPRNAAILHADGRLERVSLRESALVRGAGRRVFAIADGRATRLGDDAQAVGPALPAPFPELDGIREPFEVGGKWILVDRAEAAVISEARETVRVASVHLDAARARVASTLQADAARAPSARPGTPLLFGRITETPRGFLASCTSARMSEGALLVEFSEKGELLREMRVTMPKLEDKGRYMLPSEIAVVGGHLFVVDFTGEVVRVPLL
jgi:hypothetical protein